MFESFLRFLKIEMMSDYFEHQDLNIFLVPKSFVMPCNVYISYVRILFSSTSSITTPSFFCSNSWGRELRCFLASDQIDHIPDQIVERWYSFYLSFWDLNISKNVGEPLLLAPLHIQLKNIRSARCCIIGMLLYK